MYEGRHCERLHIYCYVVVCLCEYIQQVEAAYSDTDVFIDCTTIHTLIYEKLATTAGNRTCDQQDTSHRR